MGNRTQKYGHIFLKKTKKTKKSAKKSRKLVYGDRAIWKGMICRRYCSIRSYQITRDYAEWNCCQSGMHINISHVCSAHSSRWFETRRKRHTKYSQTNAESPHYHSHRHTHTEHRNSSTLSPASRTASITQSAPISFIVPAPHKIEIVFAFAADRHRDTQHAHAHFSSHHSTSRTHTHTRLDWYLSFGHLLIFRCTVSTMELSSQHFICYVIHSNWIFATSFSTLHTHTFD